jgi:hypothetical protein
MGITFRGPIAVAIIVVLGIFSVVLALGDVLDFYDAWWKFTVPLTLVYAAVIWIFALAPAKGAPPDTPVWPLGLDIILGKLVMTIGLMLLTLGAISLTWDLIGLVRKNWPYVVITVVLLVVVMGCSALFGRSNKSGKKPAQEPGADDIVT